MADYLRIGEVAQILGVGVDTLRRWEADGRLVFERLGGQRVLPTEQLTALTASLQSTSGSSSARNRMSGVVVRIVRDRVMVQVEIVAGGLHFVSLLSREAADELALEVGSHATAVIKSTDVFVECRTPRTGASARRTIATHRTGTT